MRTSTPIRLTPTAAEQLLDGGHGHADLRGLLAAAAGHGAAAELAGEAAAVAAFVDAGTAPPRPSDPRRRPSMLRTVLSKTNAARVVAAIAILGCGTGGVALASNVTALPLRPPAVSAPTSVPTSAPVEASPGVDAGVDASADTGVDPSPTSEPNRPDEHPANGGSDGRRDDPANGTPEPTMVAMCDAWTAEAGGDRGKPAQNPAFAELVTAAGAADDVAAYCADRTDRSGPGRSDEAPGRTGDTPGRSGTTPGQPGTASGEDGGQVRSGESDPGQLGPDGDEGTQQTQTQPGGEQGPGR